MEDQADNKIARAPHRQGSFRQGSTDGRGVDAAKGDIYGDEVHVVDKEAERRLCRKLDVRLMPGLGHHVYVRESLRSQEGRGYSHSVVGYVANSTDQTSSTPSIREILETPRPTA